MNIPPTWQPPHLRKCFARHVAVVSASIARGSDGKGLGYGFIHLGGGGGGEATVFYILLQFMQLLPTPSPSSHILPE